MSATKPILVLLPSLHRPRSLVECLDSFISRSSGLSDMLILSGESGGVSSTFNSVSLELMSQYQIVGLMGDDIRMRTDGWDSLVMDKLNGRTGMVYGRDGHQDEKLSTHPFVSSSIFLQLGFICPPGIHHFYGDNFLMDLLRPLGLIQYVPELFNEHLHPDAGKSAMDATYQESRKWWNADTEFYERYRREHLDEDRKRIMVSP